MALKFLDNWQWETTANLPASLTSTGSATITANRLQVAFNSGSALASHRLTSQETYVINQRINIGALPSFGLQAFPALLATGVNFQCGLRTYVSGKLQFYRGQPQDAFDIPIGPLSTIALEGDAVTFYDIEAKFVIGNPGTVECRVNGGVEIPPTAVNNQAAAVATADAIYLLFGESGSSGGPINFEHHIIMDGSGANLNGNFIGPVDVVLLPPTGDGFYTAWGLTGAATRWQAVETNDGDTSYIAASVVGTQNTFIQPGLPAGSTAVIATGVWVVAREDDAVTRGYKVLMRDPSGPTDALGATEFFVGPSYLYELQPFEVSPFTGIQWTVAEINQPVEFGVEVTT